MSAQEIAEKHFLFEMYKHIGPEFKPQYSQKGGIP
jgi:hypothetical protein